MTIICIADHFHRAYIFLILPTLFNVIVIIIPKIIFPLCLLTAKGDDLGKPQAETAQVIKMKISLDSFEFVTSHKPES